MEYKETGKVIGNISVVKLNENTEAADIGYCMSKSYWGQGLMPEALTAVIKYLFDVVGLNRVAASHDVNNPKSGRVMDKTGMIQEGILRASGKTISEYAMKSGMLLSGRTEALILNLILHCRIWNGRLNIRIMTEGLPGQYALMKMGISISSGRSVMMISEEQH